MSYVKIFLVVNTRKAYTVRGWWYKVDPAAHSSTIKSHPDFTLQGPVYNRKSARCELTVMCTAVTCHSSLLTRRPAEAEEAGVCNVAAVHSVHSALRAAASLHPLVWSEADLWCRRGLGVRASGRARSSFHRVGVLLLPLAGCNNRVLQSRSVH